MIPGNERPIAEIQNQLAERSIRLVTPQQFDIHVSGHPCRDELRRMLEAYQFLKEYLSLSNVEPPRPPDAAYRPTE